MRRKMHPNMARAVVQFPEVRRYVREGADRVAENARRRAPKRTGAGAASIHAEEVAGRFGGYEFRVSFDPEHYYMLFQEVGTEHQQAQPFLRPAARGLLGQQRPRRLGPKKPPRLGPKKPPRLGPRKPPGFTPRKPKA